LASGKTADLYVKKKEMTASVDTSKAIQSSLVPPCRKPGTSALWKKKSYSGETSQQSHIIQAPLNPDLLNKMSLAIPPLELCYGSALMRGNRICLISLENGIRRIRTFLEKTTLVE
jgi:hypothetical protein